jgi:ABC-type phosphate/phosphonate transport system substrate-binding protein
MDFKAAAGAYMFQAYHLLKKGIDPHKDLASLKEGKKQDDLVLAVKAGLIDAAFVRSGMLEALEKEGKIKMADFDIVDARQGDGLALVHSTDLYPEWYLAAMPGVPTEVAAHIKTAVLRMTPDMAVTKTLGVQGFVEPLSLEGVKEMLRALKIPPYNS